MSKKTTVNLILLLASALFVSAWLVLKADFLPRHESTTQQVATLTAGLWQGADLDADLPSSVKAVYLAARRQGKRLAHDWAGGGSAVADAIQKVQDEIGNKADIGNVDTLELVLASNFKKLDPRQRGWSTNIHRGVLGFEVTHGDIVERYSPTYMLATNRDTRRLLQLFQIKHGLSDRQMLDEVGYRLFEAEQWLITLGEGARVIRMERGNEFVPVEAVTQKSTLAVAQLATDWMRRNLHDDGRMTYKYWPSARAESEGNNMIRQWMATIALIRAAKYWQDDELMARAATNIDYNLAQFYSEENGYGLIEWQDKIKLGAVALAALALVEHPDAQRWAKQEAALRRTTDYLWHEDGSFTTFYKPVGRNDIQNFYPGEALLYWATLYERDKDPQRLARITASFEYYRAWHLTPANRNPAFIPWHTQAYYKIWLMTQHDGMRDFIFEMNDWLVAEMQQDPDEAIYRDTIGRFFNPDRPYGPPHVSSTGVYMEGLIDAFELARALGDTVRADRYRNAIRMGLRSVMQLQFVDEVDMYYVPRSLWPRVQGGMRTTVYNNEIRCDNVQHNLMGMLKIMQGFGISDYGHNKLGQTPVELPAS